ncbi:hypothetical protein [Flavobacterium sp. ACAM 123]|uniref:hypothetical protein n=1 Tax=Flavobacterium sp. ACAM 123 TaxID=1189620 RepID=UPI0002DB1333|nr:hypothetical protein [Flavobacterium sp. ACAM 123]
MEFIVGLVLIVAFVFLIRMFGAWMLRIDEVIELQKEQTKLLRIISEKTASKEN